MARSQVIYLFAKTKRGFETNVHLGKLFVSYCLALHLFQAVQRVNIWTILHVSDAAFHVKVVIQLMGTAWLALILPGTATNAVKTVRIAVLMGHAI
jgi:hypothetical protein